MSTDEEKQLQQLFFIKHIHLAKKYNLPLIIHNREAAVDILRILQEESFTNFVMHCFCEDLDFARKCIDFAPECKISFSGIVTFNSAENIQEAAANIPLKNIIIETDSPYLTPTPHR
jgi:TatD DNase family protein